MHCNGGVRGGHHHSAVGGFLEFSHPCLVSVLVIGPSLLEMKFFSGNFCLLVLSNVPSVCVTIEPCSSMGIG